MKNMVIENILTSSKPRSHTNMRYILEQMITLKALVGHLVVPDVLKQRKRWINNQELRKEWFSSSTN